MRQSSACTGARTRHRRMRTEERVLHSVLRPVHVDPHFTRRAKSASWWGGRFGITAGQTYASGRNQHWGRTDGRCAARRVSPLPRGRGVARQKRKEVEASVPARISELRFGCSHVVFQLQTSAGDIWPRISSAHALQKGRSGSSERGPSSGRRSAGQPVGKSVE